MQRRPSKNHNDKIRNIRDFVSKYLDSQSGKAALARTDIRVRGEDGEMKTIQRNSAMAGAFQRAVA